MTSALPARSRDPRPTCKKRGRFRVTRQIEAAGIASSIAKRVVDETFAAIDGDALLTQALARRLRGRTQIEDDREFQTLSSTGISSAQGFEPESGSWRCSADLQ